MNYLKNVWYMAAWSEEVSRKLLVRKILNEAVLLYRKEDGTPAAVADRCPHRFAPLHMGRLKGDAVECGYHGLQFDSTGTCVHNPHGDGKVTRNMAIKSYSVAERHGVVWFWAGAAEDADLSLIPDYGHLVDPARKTIKGSLWIAANYELMTDNLMDASHTQFVHADILATSAFDNARHSVVDRINEVHSNYWIASADLPRSFTTYFDKDMKVVDMWIDFEWQAPCNLKNRTGATPVGAERTEGKEKIGSHLLTPETDKSTHYFYAHSRNFGLDDERIDAQLRDWQRVAFSEQDKPIIDAVQETMGTTDLMSLRPALLSIDLAAVKTRRNLARLIDEQTAAALTETTSPPEKHLSFQ